MESSGGRLILTSYRHVAKTGDIKDVVIVEESGIAKGIRRIIAVTGEDARTVSQHASDAEAKIAQIEKLPLREKDAALKTYSQELAALEISAVRKVALREKLAAAQKDVLDKGRAQTKADEKKVGGLFLAVSIGAHRVVQVNDGVSALLAEQPDANVLVARFDVGANSKVRADPACHNKRD